MSVPALPPAPAAQFSPDTSTIQDQSVRSAIEALARMVAAEFTKVSYVQRPQQQALLTSPSGYVFSVTVADNGTVSAARVRGG